MQTVTLHPMAMRASPQQQAFRILVHQGSFRLRSTSCSKMDSQFVPVALASHRLLRDIELTSWLKEGMKFHGPYTVS